MRAERDAYCSMSAPSTTTTGSGPAGGLGVLVDRLDVFDRQLLGDLLGLVLAALGVVDRARRVIDAVVAIAGRGLGEADCDQLIADDRREARGLRFR